ncbi:MAG TPA: MarR family transcriptional regulator [Actinobacteria bacterium]|nr:MarR family transcriptional regulator [Actinomycetota bacterium]
MSPTIFPSPPPPATESEFLALMDRALASRLPGGWSLETETEPVVDDRLRVDAVVWLKAPDGTQAPIVVEVKPYLPSIRAVRSAADLLGRYLRAFEDRGVDPCGVLVSSYLSPSARELLIDRGLGFIDATGNVRVVCGKPAVFVESSGANRDPWHRSSGLRSLKGPAAGVAVRALVDFVPPYGIRELAERTGVSAPTLSRVVELLEREGLVEREPRGPVEHLDWEGTIRRWTADYGVTETNRVAAYLEPRGLPALANKLRTLERRYALTGSMALPEDVSVAPARLAMIYTRDAAGLASELDLRPTETGTNALLLEPFDDVVFVRTVERRGLVAVACSQLAADLLTGPGRAPSEGEELLAWMKDHEDAWRTRP